jgi:hypothetical protein
MTRDRDDPDWARDGQGMTLDAVRWGFRMLAGRDPLNEVEVQAFRAMPHLGAMRRTLANTHEFHAFFGALFSPKEAWTMPMFMLRPPAVAGLEWVFRPPDLDRPTSQLCTSAQFDDPVFIELVGAMGLRPSVSRPFWEQAWIVAVLATEGLIEPGRRGAGFVGVRERIASLLASRGVSVEVCVPTLTRPASHVLLDQFFPEVLRIEDFDACVTLAEVEPGAVDGMAPGAFDFVWSIGMPDRLGAVEPALRFFEASIGALRPGGIAAHCFTLNLTSNAHTWEEPGNVLLRHRDIEALAARLAEAGHRLLPLNTHPGADQADEEVTSAIGSRPGLRQRRGMMVGTSFGLAIRKAG